MIKNALVAFGLCLLITAAPAYAELAECDALYAARAQLPEVEASFNCYDAQTTIPEIRREALEKMLFSAVWIVSKNWRETASDTKELKKIRISWIEKALPLATQLVQEFESHPSGHYWTSVFLTFKCREVIGYMPSGTCILGALPKIDAETKKVLNIEPTYHGAGVSRNKAYEHIYKSKNPVFYFKPPKEEAKDALIQARKAFELAPTCSLNHIVLAKTLILNSQKSAAKEVLEKFLTLDEKNPEQIDPRYAQEAIDDRVEARALLETL